MASVSDMEHLFYDKICRVCLRMKTDMESLFNSSVLDVFKCCASVEITYGDGLPTQICPQCLDQMNLAYSFKQICQQSDEILRAHVLQGYLSIQTSEVCTALTSPLDLQATDVLEAEVIFANLPEDESSINAQHNAECIMQLMSDDDETGYLDDMRLEPECNLIENALAALEGEIQLDEENQIHSVLGSKTWERSITPLKIPAIIEFQTAVTDVPNISICDHCKATFTQKSDLSIHMSIHSEDSKIQCNKCLKIFISMPKLKRHIKTHLSVKSHKCDNCGKEFTEAGALKKHLSRHRSPDEKCHECAQCGKKYRDKCGLRAHEADAHTRDRPHVCSTCGRTFASTARLVAHRRLHNVTRKYQCSVCLKLFGYTSHLNNHMKMHTGQKPFKCEICGKSFIQLSNLKTHLQVHSGFRSHACGLCPAKFSTSSQKKLHELTHTNQRPLQCSVCGKRFARSEYIIPHMRIHTGEKPHPCPLCSKRFITSSKRNKHLEVHSRKCYICSDCDFSFKSLSQLNKHLKIHKDIDVSKLPAIPEEVNLRFPGLQL